MKLDIEMNKKSFYELLKFNDIPMHLFFKFYELDAEESINDLESNPDEKVGEELVKKLETFVKDFDYEVISHEDREILKNELFNNGVRQGLEINEEDKLVIDLTGDKDCLIEVPLCCKEFVHYKE